jgi:hypothetical protein
VDGTPNEAGSITEVIEMMLQYREHSEKAVFAVTGIGKQDVILGLTWLRGHDPEVDWKSGDESLPESLSYLSEQRECGAKGTNR